MNINDAKNEIEGIVADMIRGSASAEAISQFKTQRFNITPAITTLRLLQLIEDVPTFEHCPQTLLMEICAEVYNSVEPAEIPESFRMKVAACKIEEIDPYASFMKFHRFKAGAKVFAAVYDKYNFAPGYFQLGQYHFRRLDFAKARACFKIATEQLVSGASLMLNVLDLFDQYSKEKAQAAIQMLMDAKDQHHRLASLVYCVFASKIRNVDYIKILHEKKRYQTDPEFFKYLGNYEARILKEESGVEKLKKSCEVYPDDYNDLGLLFAFGIVVEKNYAFAAECFNKALFAGNDRAHANIGGMHLVNERKELARSAFNRALPHCKIDAHLGLAQLYSTTRYRILHKNTVQHYVEAANEGDLVAQCILAQYYIYTAKPKPELGIKRLLEATAPHDVEFLSYEYGPRYIDHYAQAKYILASLYRNGYKNFIKKDLAKALELCKEAVALGSQDAIQLLATFETLLATQALPPTILKPMLPIEIAQTLCTKGDFDSILLVPDILFEMQLTFDIISEARPIITSVMHLLEGMINHQKNDGRVEFKLGEMHRKMHNHEKAIEYFLAALQKKYTAAERPLKIYVQQQTYRHLFSEELQSQLLPPPPPQPAKAIVKHPKSKKECPKPPIVKAVVEVATPQPELILPPRKAPVVDRAAIEQREQAEREARIKKEWADLENRWAPKSQESTKPKFKKTSKTHTAPKDDEPVVTVAAAEPIKKDKGEFFNPLPLVEHDWSVSAVAKKTKIPKKERWLFLACSNQLKGISGILKFHDDYIFANGEYAPVLFRSLMYFMHRFHLHLADGKKDIFSQRFCPLLIHAHFRAEPHRIIDQAKRCYIWDENTLPSSEDIAKSKFYAHLNEDMPDNLYHIQRSLALRKMDLCIEMTYLETYRKAFENQDYLNRPEFLNAARMSLSIIGETWRRTMRRFDHTQINPDLFSLFEQCRFSIRNPEEHVIDPEAHEDAVRTKFAFDVDITSDFFIEKIWREITQYMHDNPKAIDKLFETIKTETTIEKQEQIVYLISCFETELLRDQITDLFHQATNYKSATQPSYLKYLQGKITLMRLQSQKIPHDHELLTRIDGILRTMTRADIDGISKLLPSVNDIVMIDSRKN